MGLARLHESMHRAEAEWLKKKGNGEQVNSRNDYLRARNYLRQGCVPLQSNYLCT